MIDTTVAVSSPSYSTAGRQLRFIESPSQRNARHHFIGQGEGQKRVEDWVRSQQEQKQSLWGVTVPEVHREPYVHHPNLFTIPEDPICSSSPDYSVPYIHPDEEEPFILYSSAPLRSSYNPQVIYSTPLSSPVKKSSRRPKHTRPRQRLSGLDSIPEEITVG